MTEASIRQRLSQYYQAEAAILTGQRYRIGSRELERANLKEVRAAIEALENQLAAIKAGRNPNAVRMVRVVPRDL